MYNASPSMSAFTSFSVIRQNTTMNDLATILRANSNLDSHDNTYVVHIFFMTKHLRNTRKIEHKKHCWNALLIAREGDWERESRGFRFWEGFCRCHTTHNPSYIRNLCGPTPAQQGYIARLLTSIVKYTSIECWIGKPLHSLPTHISWRHPVSYVVVQRQ